MKGLKRHNLDFEILETGNPKTIVFVDASEYMEEPDRPLLEIIPPGYNKYLLTNVVARNVNTFNSSTINLNKALNVNELLDLSDGIWTFKYKICPYDLVYVEKKFFRTTFITKKIEEVYQKLNLQDSYITGDINLHRDLYYIHILIEGSKSTVNINMKKANEYYKLADKLIDNILNKLCKNC